MYLYNGSEHLLPPTATVEPTAIVVTVVGALPVIILTIETAIVIG